MQECANLQGSKLGLESRLAEQETNLGQLKQDLLRTTLAKQTLEFEKKELLRRIDELERGCASIKSENVEKDKLIRTHKMQMEEFSRRNKEIALVVSLKQDLFFTFYLSWGELGFLVFVWAESSLGILFLKTYQNVSKRDDSNRKTK